MLMMLDRKSGRRAGDEVLEAEVGAPGPGPGPGEIEASSASTSLHAVERERRVAVEITSSQ